MYPLDNAFKRGLATQKVYSGKYGYFEGYMVKHPLLRKTNVSDMFSVQDRNVIFCLHW